MQIINESITIYNSSVFVKLGNSFSFQKSWSNFCVTARSRDRRLRTNAPPRQSLLGQTAFAKLHLQKWKIQSFSRAKSQSNLFPEENHLFLKLEQNLQSAHFQKECLVQAIVYFTGRSEQQNFLEKKTLRLKYIFLVINKSCWEKQKNKISRDIRTLKPS